MSKTNKNNKMNKKLAAAVGTGSLALVLGVGASVAYLLDTHTANNNFTLSAGIEDKIELTEPNWVEKDATNLVPNQIIEKDPTITNNSTNDVYVFIEVTEPLMQGNDGTTVHMFNYTTNSGWIKHTQSTTSTTVTTVYAYAADGVMTALKPNQSSTLFDEVQLYNYQNGNAVLGTNQQIVVKSYAIQKEGLTVSSPSDVFSLVKS